MLLKNKNVLIVGVANKHSIAAGIAQSMKDMGANLAFTYQNERLKGNVEKLAESWNSDILIPCDVADDNEIKNAPCIGSRLCFSIFVLILKVV